MNVTICRRKNILSLVRQW